MKLTHKKETESKIVKILNVEKEASDAQIQKEPHYSIDQAAKIFINTQNSSNLWKDFENNITQNGAKTLNYKNPTVDLLYLKKQRNTLETRDTVTHDEKHKEFLSQSNKVKQMQMQIQIQNEIKRTINSHKQTHSQTHNHKNFDADKHKIDDKHCIIKFTSHLRKLESEISPEIIQKYSKFGPWKPFENISYESAFFSFLPIVYFKWRNYITQPLTYYPFSCLRLCWGELVFLILMTLTTVILGLCFCVSDSKTQGTALGHLASVLFSLSFISSEKTDSFPKR